MLKMIPSEKTQDVDMDEYLLGSNSPMNELKLGLHISPDQGENKHDLLMYSSFI